MSDADEVRRKRLARLAEAPPVVPEAPTAAVVSPAKSAPAAAAPDPMEVDSTPAPAVAVPAAAIQPSTPVAQAKEAAPSPARAQQTNDTVVHQVISRIFKITLNPLLESPTTHYLSSLASELSSEHPADAAHPWRCLLADRSSVDRVVVARLGLYGERGAAAFAAAPAEARHFDALLGAYARALEEERRSVAIKSDEVRSDVKAVAEAAREIIVSYTRLVLIAPDMFPQPEEAIRRGVEPLCDALLSSFASSLSLSSDASAAADLCRDLCEQSPDPSSLSDLFTPLLMSLSHRMRGVSLVGSDVATPVIALTHLVSHKDVANLFTSMPAFIPTVEGGQVGAREFEARSVLAPFLSVSIHYDDDGGRVAKETFVGKTDAEAMRGMMSLQSTLNSYYQLLHELVSKLLRSSPESRDRTLLFFYHVANLNQGRTKMHVDRRQIGSDGLILNCLAVLLKLSEPIMDGPAGTSQGSRMLQIDSEYFVKGTRLDVANETRLNAGKEEIDEAEKTKDKDYRPNFITECFFLTAAFVHIGFVGCINAEKNNSRMAREIVGHMETLEQARHRLQGPRAQMAEAELVRLRAMHERIRSTQISVQGQLTEATFLLLAVRFGLLSVAFLENAHKTLSSSLSFRVIPEYLLEDPCDVVLLALRARPALLLPLASAPMTSSSSPSSASSLASFVRSLIGFMSANDAIKNPYLRSRLAELLMHFTPHAYEGGMGPLGGNDALMGVLLQDESAAAGMPVAMMKLYCEVENTGSSHAFYDKFPIRYNLSCIFKYLWTSPPHRRAIIQASTDTELFIRFVNHLRSDTTFLLDEGLAKLAEIHSLEERLRDASSMPPNEAQEAGNSLRMAERHAASYMSLGNETVNMLCYMTTEIRAPFLSSEIVDHFVAMLDYNVAQLVGPKCTELKVTHPERYHFRPRDLLAGLLDILLHLRSPPLVQAMARDERSYNATLFGVAIGIVRRHALRDEDHVAALEGLVAEVEAEKAKSKSEEEEMADAPDEFYDPLMATLMRDPVRLPTSNMVVDRSTIKAQLLSKPEDPFNRQPLTIEQVIPETELQQRIEAYISKKRGNE